VLSVNEINCGKLAAQTKMAKELPIIFSISASMGYQG
jgi:hypothetical protein